jgi:replicative DNA helicase
MEQDKIIIISSHDLQKRLSSLPKEPRYSMGIKGIDNLTEGFGPGELIIVTGYSGHGKTSFCQTLTMNIARNKIKSLWFSFEMTARQFLRKFNSPMPLFYIPEQGGNTGFDFVERATVDAIKKFGIRAVFIDHLHYIVEMIPKGNLSQSAVIGDVCRRLKQMAIKYNITVFLIAHTAQPKGEDNSNQQPTLSSIRDSSFIAQESDAVYAINRVKKKGFSSEIYDNDSWFLILKQRRMGTMGKKIKLSYINNTFVEALSNEGTDKLAV